MVIFSVSVISASDVNVTDSDTTSLVDDAQDVSIPIEDAAVLSENSVSGDSNVDNDPSKVSLSSEEVLESDDSNTLSTNSDSNSDDNSSDDIVSGSSNDVLTSTSGDKDTGVEVVSNSSADSDDKVISASGTSSAKISKSKTIESKSVTKYYKGNTKYTAKFLNYYGKALVNTNVKIVVNGVTYTKKTDSKGAVSLPINLKPGSYKISAINPETGYKLVTTFKILSTIGAKDISKIYTDSRKFYAKFYKSNGKALANTNVKFKINGYTYTVKTNSKGVAGLSLVDLAKGKYKIVSYNTDGLTKTNTVKVITYTSTKLTLNYYIFLKGKTGRIKTTLKHGLGYAPGEGKTIKFTINGNNYYALTNSKGVASVKVPSSLAAGIYKVKASFAGNIFYKASSVSNKVVIVSTKNPTLTVKSDTSFGQGANTPFEVAVTSVKIPLQGMKVTFKVNGKTYTKTTNSKGIASLPIDLSIGKYTIKYSVKKTSKINAKSDSAKIEVKKRGETTLSWKSDTSFSQGTNTFKVLLVNKNGKALSSRTVKLTVNSKTYTVKTSAGYATFKVNLPTGSYKVQATFPGSNGYASSSLEKTITIAKSKSVEGAYWVYGSDMKKVGLKSLASKGVSDIFLNYYAIELHGKSAVKSWISSANTAGIKVHIWVQAFYGSNGWVNPVKNGAQYTAYFNKKINEIKGYAAISGVSGIHLDYLRYPGTAYKTSGGTAAISSFVKQTVSAVRSVNPNIVVSCALMPETTSMEKYYGQDYDAISKYVDVVIPMVYKGNYGASSSWITTTTKWYVSHSKGAAVWTGLQTYKSDDDTTKLSSSALTTDVKAAVSGGATGVVLFRYGVSNSVDFTKITSSSSTSSTTKKISLKNAMAGAASLKKYYDANNKMPSTITAGGIKFTMPEFLYVMAMAMYKLGSGNSKDISAMMGAKAPASSKLTGESIYTELYRYDYVALSKHLVMYYKHNGKAPSYAGSAVGNVVYSELLDACSRVLNYYYNNNQLPNYVVIKQGSGSSSSMSGSGSGLNEKNTITSLSAYLKATTNCQVDNSKIKSLVNKVISGASSTKEKAVAIYNYVRDSISYSFYYDTAHGAVGTYNVGSGNCVDQSHLLIAMLRTADIPARYVHGTCTFSSGSTYGHVWAQALVNGQWYVVDPTSSRNSFGYVANWNTNSYSLHSKYISLPF